MNFQIAEGVMRFIGPVGLLTVAGVEHKFIQPSGRKDSRSNNCKVLQTTGWKKNPDSNDKASYHVQMCTPAFRCYNPETYVDSEEEDYLDDEGGDAWATGNKRGRQSTLRRRAGKRTQRGRRDAIGKTIQQSM